MRSLFHLLVLFLLAQQLSPAPILQRQKWRGEGLGLGWSDIYLKFIQNIKQMKVYSPPDNHQLAKIIFTAHLSRATLTHEPVPYGYKHKHFQQQNALFTTPALQIAPHQYVFGTHSILRYLAPNQPSLSAFQQAQVNQWLEVIERDLQPAVGVLIVLTNQLSEVQEHQTAKARETVVRVSKQLDERLKQNTFLVGTSLTIADISAYYSWNEVSSLLQKQTKSLANLQRWVKHLSSIPKH